MRVPRTTRLFAPTTLRQGMESAMRSAIIVAAALLLATAVQADAKQRRHVAKPRADSGVTVYDRDSPNPAIGWHTENGLRVCTNDCDNPEIPGSGARCRTINFMGMRGRECETGF
jgi:hypothetical protein